MQKMQKCKKHQNKNSPAPAISTKKAKQSKTAKVQNRKLDAKNVKM